VSTPNCSDTPGGTAQYTWTLHGASPGIPLDSGLSFCLIGNGLAVSTEPGGFSGYTLCVSPIN
jgi:hypothetical protein